MKKPVTISSKIPNDHYINQESKFEEKVIEHLTKIGGSKQWQYKPEIKTTEALWENFRKILYANNRARLDRELSITEFAQVKRIISNLDTPYKAGQFLYGVNGASQIEIDLDDGRHVFLTVFDQEQVGGGSTVYQIVNQIERPKIVKERRTSRFDVTLLMNGLPIVQIELKASGHSPKEALNQMKQYIEARQYGDIFSTLQILVAMTPNDAFYMSNAPADRFNPAFAFRWQEKENAHPVSDWKRFLDLVLSIPMAHDLATRYMILDGTKNKESIKVMRPYQVYATKAVLDAVDNHNFKYGDKRLGFVWHTTGSGKTITSFKTAWLISRHPKVDKVVFLVDRVALTNQTTDAYRAYDPIAGFEGKTGIVADTKNTSDLTRKLTKKSDKNIIVTSIQKMSAYARNLKDDEYLEQNIVFIVDEAHRSTGDGTDFDGMLQTIRRKTPHGAWVGYTGTPRIEHDETSRIFGECLHKYTIKEAIADGNVLGFNVEFKETIEAPKDASDEDIDDTIKSSIYDTDPRHVDMVVDDIIKYWDNRSVNRRYNALLTVHVGGNKASTPRAMAYFDKFIERNAELPDDKKLKVAISFSMDTSNGDNQSDTNSNLVRAIGVYNQMFGTSFDLTTVKQYTEDMARRLNRTADDGNFLDLGIVIDQLLTGFDAPEMNTLYIDRTLKGAGLIQAYSRTNRIHDRQYKPWGNVINYRWPIQNEKQMKKAFAIYSNRNSVTDNLLPVDIGPVDGVFAEPYEDVKDRLTLTVQELRRLTDNFQGFPHGEKSREETFELLRSYNHDMPKFTQYTVDSKGKELYPEEKIKEDIAILDENYDSYLAGSIEKNLYELPDELIKAVKEIRAMDTVGIKPEEETNLTTFIWNRAIEWKKTQQGEEVIDTSQFGLQMVKIQEVKINYDYLTELIAQLANEVHEDKMEDAANTKKEIEKEAAKAENPKEQKKYVRFANDIFDKEIVFDEYPVEGNVEKIHIMMDENVTQSNLRRFAKFIRHWGLDNVLKPVDIDNLIANHRHGEEDMDKQKELTNIMNEAKKSYKELADKEIASLAWIRYRNGLRKAFYELADKIKEDE